LAKLSETKVFNNKETFIDGWYWALPSKELKKGAVVGIEILGRPLAVYRGKSGRVVAIDAFCPHMGAHFQEGKVEGDSIRCAFHGWKFGEDGACVEIPCQAYANQESAIPPLRRFDVREKYGLIWIHTGPAGSSEYDELPTFADLTGVEDADLEIVIGGRTYRPCRPEVVMLNAIDAHHFNSVHPGASRLAGGMQLKPTPLNPKVLRLENRSPVSTASFLGRLLKPFYKNGAMTYFLDYWYASTGVVTLGPDFLRLFLLFPHRPTMAGGTEGIMVYIARRRRGLLGRIFGRALAWITLLVGAYFEKGDREIFESIRFSMQAPVKADHPIIEFMRHTEKQTHQNLPWRGLSGTPTLCPSVGLQLEKDPV